MLGPAFIFEARLFAWRNQLMKFTACLSIATLATLSLGAFLFAQATDIKEIMAKAKSVPIEHISETLLIGVVAATIETTAPTRMVLLKGVL